MGLVFPATLSNKEKHKTLTAKRESSVSREQVVKQLTLRNKIYLRTEVSSFKSKDE